MIPSEISELELQLNKNLIEFLNNKDLQALNNFGINASILEEIAEILIEKWDYYRKKQIDIRQ